MEPAGYQIKRITLMVFCALSILVFIVIAALSGKIVGEADKAITSELDHNHPELNQKDKQQVADISHKLVIGILIAGCIVGILFQLIGLIAAWREHFCLAITYMVLQSLGLIREFVQALRNPVIFASFGFQLLVVIVALLFVLDLGKIRRAKMSAPRY